MTDGSFQDLSQAERDAIKAAVLKRFEGQRVLGAQLGAVVREQLVEPDLRARFGGLKRLFGKYFPTEIVWSGRQGLDDLYDVRASGSETTTSAWETVSEQPSASLWAAVTNPSVYVEFAFRTTDSALLRAPAGVEPSVDLTPIPKLSSLDYQKIAREFVDSIEDLDETVKVRALENSFDNLAFTKFVREHGLLGKWELYRVERALDVFADRLRSAGAGPDQEGHWRATLRASQRQAWSARQQKRADLNLRGHGISRATVGGFPAFASISAIELRTVATRVMEFLSEDQLSALSLPLGSVLRAVAAITAGR